MWIYTAILITLLIVVGYPYVAIAVVWISYAISGEGFQNRKQMSN